MAQKAISNGGAGDGGDQFSDSETIQRMERALRKSLNTTKPIARKNARRDVAALAKNAKETIKRK
jgi:hypothetical protein